MSAVPDVLRQLTVVFTEFEGRLEQTPLIRRAVSDGDWIDDGVHLRWRRGDGQDDGLQTVGVGLWRAKAFPGWSAST